MSNYKIYSRTEKSKDPSHSVNEDSYLYTDYCFMNDEHMRVLTVADGMGGLTDGAGASFHAVSGFTKAVHGELAECYLKSDKDNFSIAFYADRLEAMLRSAFCMANREVCRNAPPMTETGTTLSVAAILGNYAVIANIGDSPVYYYNAEKKEFSLVSELQTRAEKDVENGLYERYSPEYYAHDHILCKTLGEQEELDENDIFVRVIGFLHEGDAFLIGSDGAFGRMQTDEIEEIISEKRGNEALRLLFDEARIDKNDDQTAILYRICEEG